MRKRMSRTIAAITALFASAQTAFAAIPVVLAWAVAIFSIIGVVAAVANVVINYSNKQPPAANAEATVQVSADGQSKPRKKDTAVGDDRFAHVADDIVGRKGSTSRGDLTVFNPTDQNYEPTANTDDSKGTAQPGGSSYVDFTGSARGNVIAIPPISSAQLAATAADELAQLSATFFDSGSEHVDFDVPVGDGIFAMDVDFTAGASSIFRWGFTAEVHDGLPLTIVDRRGVFSDSDLVIVGQSIVEIKKRVVNFEIPFNTETDVASNVAMSAGVAPEPASLLLFGTGAVGLLIARRRALIRRRTA